MFKSNSPWHLEQMQAASYSLHHRTWAAVTSLSLMTVISTATIVIPKSVIGCWLNGKKKLEFSPIFHCSFCYLCRVKRREQINKQCCFAILGNRLYPPVSCFYSKPISRKCQTRSQTMKMFCLHNYEDSSAKVNKTWFNSHQCIKQTLHLLGEYLLYLTRNTFVWLVRVHNSKQKWPSSISWGKSSLIFFFQIKL